MLVGEIYAQVSSRIYLAFHPYRYLSSMDGRIHQWSAICIKPLEPQIFSVYDCKGHKHKPRLNNTNDL